MVPDLLDDYLSHDVPEFNEVEEAVLNEDFAVKYSDGQLRDMIFEEDDNKEGFLAYRQKLVEKHFPESAK